MIELSGCRAHSAGGAQAYGLPAVIFQKIDGFSDVSLGLAPLFSHLKDLPGRQGEELFSRQARSPEKIACPFRRGEGSPGRQR